MAYASLGGTDKQRIAMIKPALTDLDNTLIPLGQECSFCSATAQIASDAGYASTLAIRRDMHFAVRGLAPNRKWVCKP